MDNSNKIILILVTIILIFGVILGIKIYNGNKTRELDINDLNNIYVEDETIEDTTLTSSTKTNQLSLTKDGSGYIKLIGNIIELIVIMIIVPQLLRKYNLLFCVIIMTIYRIIFVAFLVNNFWALGLLGILMLIVFYFVYYVILLWFIDKVLLDASPVVYFFGLLIFEGIALFGSTWALALLIGT